MKKNNFFFLALAGLTLASCASDEVTDVNLGNAIEFQTVVGKSTRADYTTNTLNKFSVWAFTKVGENAVTYMGIADGAGLEVKRTDASSPWTYSGTKYWPVGNVDFYAIAPATLNGTVRVLAGEQKIENYTVQADAKEDLLYTQKTTVNKTTAVDGAKVALNFKHALSKVAFTAKLATDATIKVNVQKIEVKGVDNKGTFTLGEASGSWAVATATDRSANKYVAYSPETGTDLASDAVNVNTTNDAIYLMPQTLNSWNHTNKTGDAKIIVTCTVTDSNTGVLLYNGAVAVPLSVTSDSGAWVAGKSYTYNLVFGHGAGYDETTGEPVLVPIDFNVTVDGFEAGTVVDPSNEVTM